MGYYVLYFIFNFAEFSNAGLVESRIWGRYAIFACDFISNIGFCPYLRLKTPQNKTSVFLGGYHFRIHFSVIKAGVLFRGLRYKDYILLLYILKMHILQVLYIYFQKKILKKNLLNLNEFSTLFSFLFIIMLIISHFEKKKN